MEGANVSTYTVNIDATDAEAKLDSLTKKAEYLKSLIEGINNIDEEIEAAQRLLPATMQQQPQIVYTIALGDIWSLLNAPAEGFSDEFTTHLQAFAVKHFKAKKRDKQEGKTIDLTKSNNYKKPIGEA